MNFLIPSEKMEPTIYLATRAEKKAWARKLNTGCSIIALIAAFGLFLARVIKNLSIFYLLLTVLVLCMCIQFGLVLLAYWKRSIIYYDKVAEAIGVSEQSLSIGEEIIALSQLKSIVIESDGYAGKVTAGRRSPLSGNGKLIVVHKGSNEEDAYLITIKSDDELHLLRRLSENWRTRGISAFIMD